MDRENAPVFWGALAALGLMIFGCLNSRAALRVRQGIDGLPIQRVEISSNTSPWEVDRVFVRQRREVEISSNTSPWEVPEDLAYPNATRRFPDNNRIYLTHDSMDTVIQFFMGKLTYATREEVVAKQHVKVKNDDITIDIQYGGDLTQFAYEPVWKERK